MGWSGRGSGVWGSIPSRDRYLEIIRGLAVHRSRHRRRLSVEERRAIDEYSNKHEDAAGQRINRYLYRSRRRSNPQIAGQITLLDSVLQSSRMTPPRTLFRGLRGPAVDGLTAAWTPGTEVTFPSYLSTSFMPLQALLYGLGGCILKFEIPAGTEVHAAYLPKEDEIVLQRGLSWVVTHVCDGLEVPLRATVHPIHGSPWRTPTPGKVRMYVFAPNPKHKPKPKPGTRTTPWKSESLHAA